MKALQSDEIIYLHNIHLECLRFQIIMFYLPVKVYRP